MKFCKYDTHFAPLTQEQKLVALKLMTFFGATAPPSSESISLINRIMSRSAKAMSVAGDDIQSFDFVSIEHATSVLKSIPDREALDMLFQTYFNIVAIGRDTNAANILSTIFEALDYEYDDMEELIINGKKEGVFLSTKMPDITYLNKIAVSMGKMNKILSEIEPKIKTSADAKTYWEDLAIYAYMCRIAILDRIDEHRGLLSDDMPIIIPLGLLQTRKETLASALDLTVQRLYDLAYLNYEVGVIIELILQRKGKFKEIDNMHSEEQRQKIMS